MLQLITDAIAMNSSLLPQGTFEMINVLWGFARMRFLDVRVMKVLPWTPVTVLGEPKCCVHLPGGWVDTTKVEIVTFGHRFC